MPTGIVILIVFGVVFLWAVKTPNRLERAIRGAIAQQTPTLIMEELDKRPVAFHGRFYHDAMNRLWSGQQRKLGVLLTKKFVQNNPHISNGQKWMTKIQKEEPELAQEIFSDGFWAEHYNPNLQTGGGG